jgi:hypothetical protein
MSLRNIFNDSANYMTISAENWQGVVTGSGGGGNINEVTNTDSNLQITNAFGPITTINLADTVDIQNLEIGGVAFPNIQTATDGQVLSIITVDGSNNLEFVNNSAVGVQITNTDGNITIGGTTTAPVINLNPNIHVTGVQATSISTDGDGNYISSNAIFANELSIGNNPAAPLVTFPTTAPEDINDLLVASSMTTIGYTTVNTLLESQDSSVTISYDANTGLTNLQAVGGGGGGVQTISNTDNNLVIVTTDPASPANPVIDFASSISISAPFLTGSLYADNISSHQISVTDEAKNIVYTLPTSEAISTVVNAVAVTDGITAQTKLVTIDSMIESNNGSITYDYDEETGRVNLESTGVASISNNDNNLVIDSTNPQVPVIDLAANIAVTQLTAPTIYSRGVGSKTIVDNLYVGALNIGTNPDVPLVIFPTTAPLAINDMMVAIGNDTLGYKSLDNMIESKDGSITFYYDDDNGLVNLQAVGGGSGGITEVIGTTNQIAVATLDGQATLSFDTTNNLIELPTDVSVTGNFDLNGKNIYQVNYISNGTQAAPSSVDIFANWDNALAWDGEVNLDSVGVGIYTTSGTNHWQFENDGKLTFPDTSQQTTAYPTIENTDNNIQITATLNQPTTINLQPNLSLTSLNTNALYVNNIAIPDATSATDGQILTVVGGTPNTLAWADGGIPPNVVTEVVGGLGIAVQTSGSGTPTSPIVLVSSDFYQSYSTTINFASYYNVDGQASEAVWPIPILIERIGNTFNFTLQTSNADAILNMNNVIDESTKWIKSYPIQAGSDSWAFALNAIGISSLGQTGLGFFPISTSTGDTIYFQFWTAGEDLYGQAYDTPSATSLPITFPATGPTYTYYNKYNFYGTNITGQCDFSGSITLTGLVLPPTTTNPPQLALVGAGDPVTSIQGGSGISVDSTNPSIPIVSISSSFYQSASAPISFIGYWSGGAYNLTDVWPMTCNVQRCGKSVNLTFKTSNPGTILSLNGSTQVVTNLGAQLSFIDLMYSVGIVDSFNPTNLGTIAVTTLSDAIYYLKFWYIGPDMWIQIYEDSNATTLPTTFPNNDTQYIVQDMQSFVTGGAQSSLCDISFNLVLP